jgi:hypothetical protein
MYFNLFPFTANGTSWRWLISTWWLKPLYWLRIFHSVPEFLHMTTGIVTIFDTFIPVVEVKLHTFSATTLTTLSVSSNLLTLETGNWYQVYFESNGDMKNLCFFTESIPDRPLVMRPLQWMSHYLFTILDHPLFRVNLFLTPVRALATLLAALTVGGHKTEGRESYLNEDIFQPRTYTQLSSQLTGMFCSMLPRLRSCGALVP